MPHSLFHWFQVHRRLQFDDGFGVEEPLDELGVDRQGLIAKGKTYVTFDEISVAQRRMKHLANEASVTATACFV